MPNYALRPEDVLHKSHLHRLLAEIVDQPFMAQSLAFKGGTCAAMLGYLDRFSVDLDFDTVPDVNEDDLRKEFHIVFDTLGLEVRAELDNALIFQLRYQNEPGKQNKLKVSANSDHIAANQYKVQYFLEIDRLINSQTIDTMFANKLVAVIDRYDKHQTIAGRDIYDVHHFLVQGYGYRSEVIKERTSLEPPEFFEQLIGFIQEHVNQKMINEDLNTLLPYPKFQKIRKILLPETLSLLSRERENPTGR